MKDGLFFSVKILSETFHDYEQVRRIRCRNQMVLIAFSGDKLHDCVCS